MNDVQLRSTVVATLLSIAPEVDAALLGDNRPLRRQVDLDSMDWLNFLIGLSQQLKVEIAESDYGQLVTLKDLLAYLRARLPPATV
jgi:acyl carrier protein